ncbi:hypothetical protein LNQ03_31605 [Klebsiella pneumoniae subsp. pneumoniae]|nr:hypothetical protein [Klebsiella pneumoniae subsp. pneumoniae]
MCRPAIRSSSILNQYGIDMGDIAQLSSADKELHTSADWPSSSPGPQTADGDLQSLTWEMSPPRPAPIPVWITVLK